ncbi:MAG: peptidoglycan DD-metalloendopeptidase family protein [Clostridia bacterium]|nr:peptidoglycan DD-metalloendopeptidase family protein [Clostridia bacterium]
MTKIKRTFKPLLSIVLIIMIVLTALPLGSFKVNAASNMKISDAGIEMIKSFEGFLEYAIWDYGQWSIGYGTGVPEGSYPNGISRDEAEVLLRQYLDYFESCLNKFIVDYNVSLNQNQFDALMSFIYNLGPSVLNYEKMTLRDMIVSGDYTDQELIDEFKTWSHAGGVQLAGLVRRREAEALLFLTPYTYYEIWEADVESSSIRLRSEPSTSADTLEYIYDDTLFIVTNHKAGDGYLWGYTSYNGVNGWCAIDLANKVFDSNHTYKNEILNNWCFPVLDFTKEFYEGKTWLTNGYSDTHSGIDIGNVTTKTPVYASASGWIHPQTRDEEKGIWAIIDHSDDTYSSYQHLSSVIAKEKQWVNKGDIIGYCDNSELHFEVKIGASNNADSYDSMQTVNPEHIAFNYSSDLIYSVSHLFDNQNIIFTVITDSEKIDTIKLVSSSNKSEVLSTSTTYEINSDGNYVWTITTTVPSKATTYSFDVRSSETKKYLERYYEYSIDPTVSSTIKSALHEYADGELTFSIITKKGEFERIKVANADELSSSLAVATSYARTPSGDFLWTIKYKTENPIGIYAFDLKSSSNEKYLKDYFTYEITEFESAPPNNVPDVEIWRVTGESLRLRTSPSTSAGAIIIIPTGTYLTVTETTTGEGYTWGKVSFSNYSGWCALDYAQKINLPTNFYSGWYWPVPSSSPQIYTNGSWLLNSYSRSLGGIDITNVSTKTPVYAAKSGYLYIQNTKTAVIDHGDRSYSSYGNLSSIMISSGTFVNKGQLIGYCGDTSLHFEIRVGIVSSWNSYSLFASFDPQFFGYSYESNLIKSVSSSTVGNKLTFTVVTQAGDFNRLKVTDANDLSSYIKYTDTYEVNSNGEFVWTITITAPSSDTSYAFDLRGKTTSKYTKLYGYYDYEVVEAPVVTYKSVSHEIVGDHIVFTIVTNKGDYNRMKLSYVSNIATSLAVSNSCTVNSDGDYLWTIKYAAPKVSTTYAFDLRSSVTSKYLKEYYTYTVEPEVTSPIIYSTSKIESGRITFQVVTTAGDFNRIKLTTEDKLSGSIAVASSYTVNSEGNYVWIINAVAPSESTTYAFDLRNGTTGKYLKDYYYQEVLVSEDDDVTPILTVSPVVSDDKITFTVVTGTDYNRVKVVDSNDMSSYITYTNKYVEVGSVRVWTITITKPDNKTLFMFDARAISNNKYTKNYYNLTA